MDTEFSKFKDKMNELMKSRIPLTYQDLNFHELKDDAKEVKKAKKKTRLLQQRKLKQNN